MIREIIRVILQPLKAVWSIFDNDAHKIISKRGIEVLEEQKTKIDSIHDVIQSDFFCHRECTSENKCSKQCYLCIDMEKHSV